MTKGRKPSLETVRKNLGGRRGKPPKCPPWLDDGAKSEWRRLAPELIASGRLTSADLQSFANYCQATSRLRKVGEQIAADGLMIEGPRERMIRNPLCDLELKLQAEIRQAADRFGLNPSSRARVDTTPPNDEVDEFEAFQKDVTNG